MTNHYGDVLSSDVSAETKTCSRCKTSLPIERFKWKKDPRYLAGGTRSGVCATCHGLRYRSNRDADPVRADRHRSYQADWSKAHQLENKVKAYRQHDAARGVASITLAEARRLIVGSQCYYCGESDASKIGLDRIHNDGGHSIENVKVCCELCNNILSDLPFTAKDVIGKALREVRERGLLTGYTLKTKRRDKGTTKCQLPPTTPPATPSPSSTSSPETDSDLMRSS